jgi:hypothetical protein
LGSGSFLEIGLGQNRLLEISYYAGGRRPPDEGSALDVPSGHGSQESEDRIKAGA